MQGGLHSSVWSTKTFLCQIRSRGISKKKCGIRFKEFEKLNNLIFSNLIPPWFMHNFSSNEYFTGLGNIPFKGNILRQVSCSKPLLYNITEPNIIIWDMGFQNSRLSDVHFFRIWYPILICLYLGSLISYRNFFVLQTKQWIPPFK